MDQATDRSPGSQFVTAMSAWVCWQTIPFVTRAVVAKQQNQRVVEVARGLQMLDDLPDSLIHCLDHRREHGQPAGKIATFDPRSARPRQDSVSPENRWQCRRGRPAPAIAESASHVRRRPARFFSCGRTAPRAARPSRGDRRSSYLSARSAGAWTGKCGDEGPRNTNHGWCGIRHAPLSANSEPPSKSSPMRTAGPATFGGSALDLQHAAESYQFARGQPGASRSAGLRAGRP